MAVAINFPVSQKLFGANIGWDINGLVGGVPNLEYYWSTWPWSSWIVPNITRALSLGCNSIRMVGNWSCIPNQGTTQQQLLDRWTQLLEYCKHVGLSVYCCIATGHDSGTFTSAQLIAYEKAWMDALGGSSSPYLNTVCLIDQCNETSSTPLVGILYNALRPYANTPAQWPLTCSLGAVPFSNLYTDITTSDCIEVHYYSGSGGYSYASPATLTDMENGFRTNYPTLDVLIGEYGVQEGNPQSDMNVWFSSGQSIGQATSDSKLRGTMFWVIQDNQGWGVFDPNTGAPLPKYMPAIMSTTLGAGASVLPPSAPRSLPDNNMVWSPMGCTNNWASTNLYRYSGTTKTKIVSAQLNCMTDDSAVWSKKLTGYKATAVDGSSNESAESTLCVLPGRLPPRMSRRRVRAGLH